MPCDGAGAAPLQIACRVNGRGALSVDPLARHVTPEQPEQCRSTMPPLGRDCQFGVDPVSSQSLRRRLTGRS